MFFFPSFISFFISFFFSDRLAPVAANTAAASPNKTSGRSGKEGVSPVAGDLEEDFAPVDLAAGEMALESVVDRPAVELAEAEFPVEDTDLGSVTWPFIEEVFGFSFAFSFS